MSSPRADPSPPGAVMRARHDKGTDLLRCPSLVLTHLLQVLQSETHGGQLLRRQALGDGARRQQHVTSGPRGHLAPRLKGPRLISQGPDLVYGIIRRQTLTSPWDRVLSLTEIWHALFSIRPKTVRQWSQSLSAPLVFVCFVPLLYDSVPLCPTVVRQCPILSNCCTTASHFVPLLYDSVPLCPTVVR